MEKYNRKFNEKEESPQEIVERHMKQLNKELNDLYKKDKSQLDAIVDAILTIKNNNYGFMSPKLK